MAGEIIIPEGELPKLLAAIAEQVAARIGVQLAPLPRYYKFPEDIVTMTGGHIPTGTILGWKTSGFLRTFKIGRRAYVDAKSWQWFLDNHAKLMAKAPNSRRLKLVRSA